MIDRRVKVLPVLDESLRSISICLAVPRGSRHDPSGQGGLAHVLEHVLMSAPTASGEPLCQYVEGLGGAANAQTGLESMLFHVRVLADDADEVLDLLLKAVLRAQFDSAAFEAERSVVLRELSAAAADPMDEAQDAFLTALFPGHPLGRPVGGTEAEVTGLDLPAVVAGYHAVFDKAPFSLAVVGPRLPARLASSPTSPPADGLAAQPDSRACPLEAVREDTVRWPGEFGWLAIGGRSAPRSATASYAYELLAALLGGSPSSLMYRSLRDEHGLAYSFQAWNRGYLESGAWRVLIGTEPGSVTAVVGQVRALLSELAEHGPSPRDLEAAKRQAITRAAFDMEDPLEHAQTLAQRDLPGGPGAEADVGLAAVSAMEIRDAARRILSQFVMTIRPEGN
jgi:predicted Zn-dependent peptidase